MKQSGGEVIVESTPGAGATFTLYLPHDPTGVPAGVGIAAEARGDGPSLRILVVEDNAAVGDFAMSALADLGHAIVFARDAEEALAILAREVDAFDVMFSDVVMPGMNGVALAQYVRRDFPAMRVLLTSGYSDVISKDGAQGFALLHKPYSMAELARALHAVMEADRPLVAGAF